MRCIMDKIEKEVSTENLQPQIVVPTNVEQKKWICEVCGYANPEYTALCKKCSNYLERR